MKALKSAMNRGPNVLFCRDAYKRSTFHAHRLSPRLPPAWLEILHLLCAAVQRLQRSAAHTPAQRGRASARRGRLCSCKQRYSQHSQCVQKLQLNATRTCRCYLMLPVPRQVSCSTCRKEKEEKLAAVREEVYISN